MNVKKTMTTLALGIVGGFIAFLIANGFTDKEQRGLSSHELIGPGLAKRVAYQQENGTASGTGGLVDLREAAKKTVPGVVHVKTMQMGKEYLGNPLLDFWFGNPSQSRDVPMDMGFGSGVIISNDGYIITNSHVVKGADQVIVISNDKKEYEAKVIGQDANTDIALLKIDGKDLPSVEYGNSDDVALGEWVLAVGNPYNLTSTVTAGIISAKGRDLGVNRGQMNLESFLQTDAAVNPGNSGGALVNARGELIGINTLIQSPTGAYSGYAFAVPVNIARKVINDLKDYGKVQRAVLGVRMGELTPALADKMGIKEASGIYISEVISGGAAEKAGIKAGDVVQAVNGIEVKTAPEFQEQLGQYRPGVAVEMKIKREGAEKLISTTLQNSYGDTSLEEKEDFGVLGVKVKALGREERARFRLNKGVKITDIKNGKFKSAGLEKDDVILKINDYSIYDQDDLAKAIQAAGEGGVFVTALNPGGQVEYFAFSLLN